MTGRLAYHLQELETARNPDDPRRCMPQIGPHDHAILDIGCGIGQLFAAGACALSEVLAVGVDIDQEPLAYGARMVPGVRFLLASGDALPLAAERFDLVVSRVSLPYTNLPRALDEIARVLRPGGRLWLSLHPIGRTWRELGAALRGGRPKDAIFRGYILLNGVLLHGAGRVLPFPPNGRYESFQTGGGMLRLLRARGFTQIAVDRARHFVVTAHKPAAASSSSTRESAPSAMSSPVRR